MCSRRSSDARSRRSRIDELECGLGSNGPVLCHWTLAFGVDGTFEWMYSDIGQSGSYNCDEGVMTIADGPMRRHRRRGAQSWPQFAAGASAEGQWPRRCRDAHMNYARHPRWSSAMFWWGTQGRTGVRAYGRTGGGGEPRRVCARGDAGDGTDE